MDFPLSYIVLYAQCWPKNPWQSSETEPQPASSFFRRQKIRELLKLNADFYTHFVLEIEYNLFFLLIGYHPEHKSYLQVNKYLPETHKLLECLQHHEFIFQYSQHKQLVLFFLIFL